MSAAPRKPMLSEGRARVGSRVPEHVYLEGRPLMTAASPEQAAKVVDLLNTQWLLIRYIEHVGQCEGSVFLAPWHRTPDLFSDEEWAELERLSELKRFKDPEGEP